jgi:hypothetical protein
LHSASAGKIPAPGIPHCYCIYVATITLSGWTSSGIEKNTWLKERRGIAFEEIEGSLMEGEYLDIIDTLVREGQQFFIMSMHDYTWVVRFVVSDDERVVLKTAFRSRKCHKI